MILPATEGKPEEWLAAKLAASWAALALPASILSAAVADGSGEKIPNSCVGSCRCCCCFLPGAALASGKAALVVGMPAGVGTAATAAVVDAGSVLRIP